MLKSYIKIALRNLIKNKAYSIINIVGLGVAIAVCITAYVNYEFSQSYDSYHENADKIYSVNSYRIVNNNRQNWSYTPLPMASIIKNDIPGIEKFSRISVGRTILRYGDKVFNEVYHLMDEDFFEMFTYPMIYGTEDALKDKSGMVITDEIAEKYFGDENPIGKQIIMSVGRERDVAFFIRGVIRKPPQNSSMPIRIIVSIEKIEELRGFDPMKWDAWARAVFIQIEDNTSLSTIEKQLQSYLQITNEVNPDFQMAGFYLDSLPQLAFHSRELNGSPFFPGMHPAALIAPSVIAILILLLACFNFVNTAIAFASKRLKEIGIRKVVGGMRNQLIKQYLGENLVLCAIALLFGILLAEVFVPAYDSLWPELSLTMNYAENLGLIGFLVGLLFFTAIAAGAYPAFYISAFNPVNIFRGKQKLGGTNPLIRVLLTFQFALSITAIIAGIILNQNAEFIENFDLGFNKEQIINIPVNGEDNYKLVKNAIEDHPNIVSIGGSRHLMGRSWTGIKAESGQTKTDINLFEIGEDYFETAGLELAEGRTFERELKTDIDQSIVVNETLIREFGWDSFTDKKIKFITTDSEKEYKVIGVVNDFHYNGVWNSIRPVALRLTAQENYRYAAIKFTGENIKAISTYLQDTWKQLFPHLPYDGFFQDEILAEASMINESIRLVFLYIALIAVLIAGMGLYALVSLNIAKRTKEIGIRKILGASIPNISRLISKEFVLLLLIGSVLASIMGYFLVDSLLGSIWAYYVDFGAMPFIFSAVAVFLLAMLTVSSQVFSVAKANPVNAIRDE